VRLAGEQVLLRVYLRSGDRAPRVPTYERVVRLARAEGLAGATVLKGVTGFGPSWDASRPSRWSLVEHVPVIVEVVDAPEVIRRFVLGPLGPLVGGAGVVTLERAHVMRYVHGAEPHQPQRMRLGELVKPLSTVPAMTTDTDGVLLRVFVGESDRHEGRPLYEAIVQLARDLGLAGATALRGAEGFGAHSVVHKSGILDLSSDLPFVVEVVDTEEKVNAILPHLDTMVREGLVTMEHVRIVTYRQRSEPQSGNAHD
jgi:PII-like signaling protein